MQIMKKYIYVAIFCLISFVCLGTTHVLANENDRSEVDYHHIYPQQYFKSVGHPYTFELKTYDHIWLHSSGGFDNDWEKVADNVPFIWKMFGNPQIADEDAVTMYSKRNAALITGSRIISYTIFTYDYRNKGKSGLLAMHFDGVSNALYNVSYIMSIPAKFVHFSLECFKRGTGMFNGNRKVYGIAVATTMFLWMLWTLFSGLLLAIVGLFIGTLIGIVCHPFQTLGNLIFSANGISDAFMNNLLVSLFDMACAVIKPLWQILFW